jgi:uncharacterized membrane protein HdeD (DUF308 family)
MADRGRKAIRLSTVTGGVLSILTGAILLVWPGKTLLFVAAMLGVWLIIIGIVRLVQAFRGKDRTPNTSILLGVSGVLYAIVGAVCLSDLFASVEILSVIIGLVWIVGGVAEIAWRKQSSILLGALSFAAGLVVLIWPEISLLAMALIGGVWLVAFGVLQLVLGLVQPRAASPAESG